MPVLDAQTLSLVDILLLAIILLGLPLESLLTLKSSRARLASGAPGARVRHYAQTIFVLWGVSIPIIILWAMSHRDWALLGFQIEASPAAMTGWGLAILIAAFFALQNVSVARSDKLKQQLRAGLQKNAIMTNFMPQTEDERYVFNIMGVSAGIAEEIIFRGYLIWALSLLAPVWIAAIAALLIFTVLHLYQGLSQLPTIFASGTLVTLVFLLSGSLWPAILLHVFVDVANNNTVWKARWETG